MMIEFENMNTCHMEEVYDIEVKCFALPWNKNMLEEELENRLAHYVVVLCNGVVAGYAGMWYILDEAHITNIAVNPSYQSLGLGNALLDHIIKMAEKDGIKLMTLEVRSGNTRAISLYHKFDFVDFGRRRNYYADNKEDAIIMWRKS